MLSVYKAPKLVDLTNPLERLDKVVEPVTERVPVMEVVARVVMPETVRAVAEAVVKLVWPLPQRIPEMEMLVAEATPSMGVIRVGEVCWTVRPLPVTPLL